MRITKRCRAVLREKPISGERSSEVRTVPQPPLLTAIRVYITSDAFKGKMQPARHRMVYQLMKDELAAEGGIHALQLRTRTVEEEERAQAKGDS